MLLVEKAMQWTHRESNPQHVRGMIFGGQQQVGPASLSRCTSVLRPF